MPLNDQQVSDLLNKAKQSGLSREDAKVLLQKADQRSGGSRTPVQPQKPSFMQNVASDVGNIWQGIKSIPSYLKNVATDPRNQMNANKMIGNIGKDLVKGTVGEYNELAGRPLEGGDVLGRIGERAYEKPVTTALDILPGVSFLKKLGGAKNATKAPSAFRQSLATKADEIATRGLGNPARQAKMTQKSGRSVGSFIDEYNLYDRNPATAKEVTQSIGEKFSDVSQKSNETIKAQNILFDLDMEKAKLLSGYKGQVSDSALKQLQGINKFKDRFVKAFGTDGEIPVGEYTTFRKALIDPDIPNNAWNLDPATSSEVSGLKTARSIGRKSTIDVVPELEKLGMDYGMAKELEKIIEANASRVGNRQLLNFTKLGSAGVGAFLSGIPGLVGGFLTEQFINSPKFIEIISKSMRKLSQAEAPIIKVPSQVKNVGLFGQGARLIDQKTTPTDQETVLQGRPQSFLNPTPLFNKFKGEISEFKKDLASPNSKEIMRSEKYMPKDLYDPSAIGGMVMPLSQGATRLLKSIKGMPSIGQYEDLMKIAIEEAKMPKSVVSKMNPTDLYENLMTLLPDNVRQTADNMINLFRRK